jgi:hypothetical protein
MPKIQKLLDKTLPKFFNWSNIFQYRFVISFARKNPGNWQNPDVPKMSNEPKIKF